MESAFGFNVCTVAYSLGGSSDVPSMFFSKNHASVSKNTNALRSCMLETSVKPGKACNMMF